MASSQFLCWVAVFLMALYLPKYSRPGSSSCDKLELWLWFLSLCDIKAVCKAMLSLFKVHMNHFGDLLKWIFIQCVWGRPAVLCITNSQVTHDIDSKLLGGAESSSTYISCQLPPWIYWLYFSLSVLAFSVFDNLKVPLRVPSTLDYDI